MSNNKNELAIMHNSHIKIFQVHIANVQHIEKHINIVENLQTGIENAQI